jgi:pimeloyl-ACP methyl ester carboxylesterase
VPERAAVGDVRIAYEVAGGAGPPIVLIMGLGVSSLGWESTVPWLSERFRVITFDNRGCGGSDTPPGLYSTSQMADDVAGLLHHLGIDSAHVYGISLGGMIAQELAIRHPQRVRALVLGATACGGAASHPPDPLLFAGLAARTLGPARVAELPPIFEVLFSPAFVASNRQALIEYAPKLAGMLATTEGYRRQLAATVTHDTASRLHLIQAPTLVIQGGCDRLVPPANARLLSGRIARAELCILGGAGHAFEHEQPEAAREVIGAFLERHRDAPPGTRSDGREASAVARAGRTGGAIASHAGRYAVAVPYGLARRGLGRRLRAPLGRGSERMAPVAPSNAGRGRAAKA